MYMGEVNTYGWKPQYFGTRPFPGTFAGFGSLGFPIFPAISAAGSLTSGIMSIFGSKPQHYSPWGFHVDQYAQHIIDAENQIIALKNAISQVIGGPMLPTIATPPAFSNSTKQQWYDTMRPIVAQYSTQADCVTNNNQVTPGGCYEQTYTKQLQLIEGLKQQLAQVQQGRAIATSVPYAGSPTALPPISAPQPYLTTPYPGYQQPMLQTPVGMPGTYYASPISPSPQITLPTYLPSVSSPIPSTVTVTTPGAIPSQQPSGDIFAAGLGSWPLLAFGGIALLLMTMGKSQPARVRVVHKPRKRR